MSNLTYEVVLDQALALSPEDRARLIYQLVAREQSPADARSDTNHDNAVEYLPLKHPNVDWKSPMAWLRINRDKYRGQWVGLDGGRLVANGSKASEVFAAVHAEGMPLPFIAFIAEDAYDNGARVFNFF
ncbi:MAG: hypothetical protein J2P41_17365 [Blastocatellia bacterium]|nr:hypothetical protein [Blastocatellia bacterium]